MANYCKFLIFSFLFTFSACQNEGNIGDLYGHWALKSSVIDGNTTQYDNLYLSFQGEVVWAKSVNADNHTYNDVFGRFTHQSDSLIMVFTQHSEATTPASLIEKKFGFDDYANVRVAIKLDDSQLRMTSGSNTWLFSKY